MIRLVDNADAKIKELVFENSVRSFYYCACEHYANGYVNPFIDDMQKLVTKLGIMVSRVSNGPSINYCYTAIHYLCGTVLDNPDLAKTFNDIGLNEKGNQGKHTIAKNVNIDMLRCVTTYNNLVNRIADKYGLRSLKYMVVRKSFSKKEAMPIKQSSNGATSTKSSMTKIKRPPTETSVTNDGKIQLKAHLERGEGRYTKGLFHKKGMVNFKLRVSIKNQEGLKILKAEAFLKGKGEQIQKKLPTLFESVTEFDLPTDDFGGHIEASVLVTYKIGLFKTKQIKATVSKNF